MKTLRIVSLFLVASSFFASVVAQSPQTEDARVIAKEFLTFYQARDYKAALPKAVRLVEIFKADPASSAIDRANSHRFLGLVQYQLGDQKNAIENLGAGISILESESTANGAKTLLSNFYDEISVFLSNDGKPDRAIIFAEKAIAVKTELFGDSSVEVADSLSSLATFEYLKRDYDKSFDHYQRAYEIRAAKLGLRDESTMDAEMRYDCAAKKSGRKFVGFKAQKNPNDPVDLQPRVIDGGVVNGKALSLAKPPYPMEARTSRASGAVQVSVLIDENGRVIFACAVSGHMLLQPVSEAAAYASVFSPTTLNGKRVKLRGAIIYNFMP